MTRLPLPAVTAALRGAPPAVALESFASATAALLAALRAPAARLAAVLVSDADGSASDSIATGPPQGSNNSLGGLLTRAAMEAATAARTLADARCDAEAAEAAHAAAAAALREREAEAARAVRAVEAGASRVLRDAFRVLISGLPPSLARTA
jgi:hypothetical protein